MILWASLGRQKQVDGRLQRLRDTICKGVRGYLTWGKLCNQLAGSPQDFNQTVAVEHL